MLARYGRRVLLPMTLSPSSTTKKLLNAQDINTYHNFGINGVDTFPAHVPRFAHGMTSHNDYYSYNKPDPQSTDNDRHTAPRDRPEALLDDFSALNIGEVTNNNTIAVTSQAAPMGSSHIEFGHTEISRGGYNSSDVGSSTFDGNDGSNLDAGGLYETNTVMNYTDNFSHYGSSNIEAWTNYPSDTMQSNSLYRRGASYDPLYHAASNILGLSPPPPSSNDGESSLQIAPSFSQSSFSNREESAYSSHLTSNGIGGSANNQTSLLVPSAGVSSSARTISDASSITTQGSGDSGSRPILQRSATSASVRLGTKKNKAVDLRAPPYTKEYVDQYRQRIKGDPDPEAHFLYAKYLIEAARKIGANASDQKAVKKYRELLVLEALKVIRRLALQGDAYPEAQFFLANCHGTGALGLQVDHEKAYHLYLQSAKQNHAAASYRVAVCNEIGAGTKREPPRAFAFYRKAASLGDTAAMYKLGVVLLTGSLSQPINTREAIGWLRRAAEQADEENPHALHELGLLYEAQDSRIVQHDPVYAKELFTKAAQLGYTQSQYKLGQCYEYGTLSCPVDPRRSIAWYTKAAEKGDPEAELALSGWYLTGSEGVLKQSDSEAYLWARRAANKGLSKAEYAVGYYAEVGIGVKQDIDLAKKWYMRAAAQGNKRAMNRLTELKRMGNKRGNVSRPTRQQAKDECIIC